MKTILIRADASVVLGSGHVMRCMTLANQLRNCGYRVIFLHKRALGDLSEVLKASGFELFVLNQEWSIADEGTHILALLDLNRIKADWLIVDHYEIDEVWESQFLGHVKKIMVIDDLANRAHKCDLILDQNFYLNMEDRYQGLLPVECIQLLGPSYALMRPEFLKERNSIKIRDGVVNHLLVFYGGSDPTNETLKAVEAIDHLGLSHAHTHVVVGNSNPHKDLVRSVTKKKANMSFYCQITNMAELMAMADLSFGAGGTATWERLFLGLPTIATIVAENQKESVETLDQIGLVKSAGWYTGVSSRSLAEAYLEITQQQDGLAKMSADALIFMGEGQFSTIINELLKG